MTGNDTASPVYAPSPDVVARDIAGEHLLMPVRSGLAEIDCLFTADEVGSFIFSLLDGRRSTAAIAVRVSEAYDVDETRARADVDAFLAELAAAGLARRATDDR